MSLNISWNFKDNDILNVVKKNQQVDVHIETIEMEQYLLCKSQQTRSTPGIKIIDIVIPNNGNEYCLEVDGFANNSRSFIWASDETGQRLIKSYIVLPEMIVTGEKLKPTYSYFTLNPTEFEKEQCTISIGILIGGNAGEPTKNDIFCIKSIKLYEKPLNDNVCYNKKATSGPLDITRIYESLAELENELPHPNRTDGEPIQEGEYALIKSLVGNGIDNGKLFVAIRQRSDIESSINLRYVCNITGSDTIYSRSLHLAEDQIIPIYDDETDVIHDLNNTESRDSFYSLEGNTKRKGYISKKNGPVFMYFDTKGYVRWVSSNKVTDLVDSVDETLISSLSSSIGEDSLSDI